MGKIKSAYVTTIDEREIYVHPADPKNGHPEPYLVWRVPDVREAITAPPGYKVLGADYSQIEVRIMAWESQDKWLLEALNSGKDIHCKMASDVNKIPYDEFYAAYKNPSNPLYELYYGMRSDIKTTTFGVPYGAGAGQIARQINSTRPKDKWVDEAYAQKVIDDYFKKAIGLKAWLTDQGDHAIHYGFSKSLGGHYRFYRIPSPEDKRAEEILSQIRRWAGNHPIQAGCADMLKMAIGKISCDLHEEGLLNNPLKYDAHFTLFVHDEIVMIVKDEHVEAVKKIIVDAMQWSYNKLIPLEGKTPYDHIIHSTDVTVAQYWKKG